MGGREASDRPGEPGRIEAASGAVERLRAITIGRRLSGELEPSPPSSASDSGSELITARGFLTVLAAPQPGDDLRLAASHAR